MSSVLKPWAFKTVVLAFLAASVAGAQTVQDAQALFGEGKLKEAAAAYRALTEQNQKNGAAWYGLARSLHENGSMADALAAYEKTVSLGFSPARTQYHLARLHALAARPNDALKALRAAQQAGMTQFQILQQTKEFHTLHALPEFQTIVTEMRPCREPEYKQFDFWLGTWEVTTPQGQPAGSNRILRVQGNCVIQENWTAASGGTGTSYNTFNKQKGMWQQFWVDAQGTVLQIEGGLEGESMVMSSDPDVSPLNRITWTPNADGTVRQLWETSNDLGRTWSVAFDGIYKKTH